MNDESHMDLVGASLDTALHQSNWPAVNYFLKTMNLKDFSHSCLIFVLIIVPEWEYRVTERPIFAKKLVNLFKSHPECKDKLKELVGGLVDESLIQ